MTPEEYNEKRRKDIEARNNPIKDFGIKCNKLLSAKDKNEQECGGRMLVDTSVQLMSNPPQYSIQCEKCGRTGYIYC